MAGGLHALHSEHGQAARPGGASSVSTPLPIKNHNNLAEAVKVSDPNLTFAQLYELKEKLGKGQYAVVHRALHRTSKLECAVKCIRKATLTAEDLAALEIEVAAQRRLGDHPNFVRMYQYFEEKDFFFIVLELISGGELFERIVEKERYSEREARDCVRQLTKAIGYMHAKGVAHRDLKPENILLKSKTDDTSIKVADLGFAKLISSRADTMTTPCGTPGYVAPEILGGKPYTCASDVWSLGVIFYILLCGYPPFASERDDTKELFNLIKAGKYSFDPREWGAITDGAKDLVRHILVTEPSQRYTVEQILAHPWMQQDASAIPDAPLAGTVEALKRFNARRRLKSTLKAVRTTIRMKLLLAARMQRMMDAARASAAASAGEGSPVPEPEEDLPVDQAIVRALKAAEARGMAVPDPAAKAKAAEDEQARLLQNHLAATSMSPLPSSGGGVPKPAGHKPVGAAQVPRTNSAGTTTANPLMMSPALGVVHGPGSPAYQAAQALGHSPSRR